jgi:hypothetical protein
MKQQIIEKSFSTFNSRDYLNEYYSSIGSENESLMQFYAQIYKAIDEDSVLLEFSGGPTIYPLITAASKVKAIHFSDYLKANRDEVKLWKSKDENAFDWDIYFKRALELEGSAAINNEAIQKREELLRTKIKKIIRVNAFKSDPINEKSREAYDVISVNFVPESITDSEEQWEATIHNITSMLKNGGILVTTALKNATYYKVGNKLFPAVNITEKKLEKTLNKFGLKVSYLKTVPAQELDVNSPDYEGYKGFIFIVAKKAIK